MNYKLSRVVRGGVWLYGTNIVNNLSGFIYWLVISGIAGSSVLGLTSATIGLGTLITGLLNLGVNIGLQKHLGYCIGVGDKDCLRRYLWSTFSFIFPIYLLVGASILAFGLAGYHLWNYSSTMLVLAGVIVVVNSISYLSALFPSMLRTDIYFLSILIGNILKLAAGIGLVYIGYGWVGAVIGYIMVSLSIDMFSLLFAVRTAGFSIVLSRRYVVEVLKAGIASWLPGVVVLAGQWLGVLSVFGSSGAIETGYYYVAFVISGVVLAVANSLLSLMLPVLSGMTDGRKRAADRVLRISNLFMVPIAVWTGVYPWVILGLLGREYVSASNILRILITSSVPLSVTFCVTSLAYAYDMYLDVLFMGLAQNVPRMILYPVLVPLLGGLGSAIAFTAGSYTGFIYTLLVAGKIGFKIDYSGIAKIILIPLLLALPLLLLDLHWLLGIIIIVSSYLVYGRLGLVTRSDIKDIGSAVLSEEKLRQLYEKFKPIIDLALPS